MSGQLSALKVLIADDNAHARAIVTAILSGVSIHRMQECSDGAQAFECARQWKPDLAIVDFQMAPMDGVEFTRLVRNSPDSPSPRLPIIMLTGFAEKARVFEARDAGVNEFIVKPITAQAVLDRIHAVIFKPRPFVQAASYHGPCRRRRQDPDFIGPFRRSTDARAKAHSLSEA